MHGTFIMGRKSAFSPRGLTPIWTDLMTINHAWTHQPFTALFQFQTFKQRDIAAIKTLEKDGKLTSANSKANGDLSKLQQ